MIADRRSGARLATSSAGTDVVGIVPDEASSFGPSAALWLESNDKRALPGELGLFLERIIEFERDSRIVPGDVIHDGVAVGQRRRLLETPRHGPRWRSAAFRVAKWVRAASSGTLGRGSSILA